MPTELTPFAREDEVRTALGSSCNWISGTPRKRFTMANPATGAGGRGLPAGSLETDDLHSINPNIGWIPTPPLNPDVKNWHAGSLIRRADYFRIAQITET